MSVGKGIAYAKNILTGRGITGLINQKGNRFFRGGGPKKGSMDKMTLLVIKLSKKRKGRWN